MVRVSRTFWEALNIELSHLIFDLLKVMRNLVDVLEDVLLPDASDHRVHTLSNNFFRKFKRKVNAVQTLHQQVDRKVQHCDGFTNT